MNDKEPALHVWGQLTRFTMPLEALLLTANPAGSYDVDDVATFYLQLREYNRRSKLFSTPIFSKTSGNPASGNFSYDATEEEITASVLESDFAALASVAKLGTVYTWNFGIVIAGTTKPWEVLPGYWMLPDNNNRFMWYDAAVEV